MLCTQTPATARQEMRGGRESKKMEGRCMCVTDAFEGPDSRVMEKMCDTQTLAEGCVLTLELSPVFFIRKWSFFIFLAPDVPAED